jgi:DNA-binding transcriptional ArsR family regulator
VDEIIVRVARAVACLARLRMLTLLANEDEMAPTELADTLDMRLNLVCDHLRRLSAAGLIARRRSGRWHYCSADSPYAPDAFSGKVSRWLRETLRASGRKGENSTVHELRNPSPRAAIAARIATVFDAATAFANVRRLQILRALAAGKGRDAAWLMRELHMSAPAVTRHTRKLIRRGYVTARRTGRRRSFQLADTFKTRVHARLLQLVSERWQEEAPSRP